jgi:hypothetical protein
MDRLRSITWIRPSLWLAAAALLLFASSPRHPIALAAWLAPLCMLRFTRAVGPWRGLALGWLGYALWRNPAATEPQQTV